MKQPNDREFNKVDKARPTAVVRELYAGAKKLGFTEDEAHWKRLLESRGETVG